MKTSRIILWGLTMTLVPMLALASTPAAEDSTATPSSQSMETPDQNTGGMSRQGGASGMEDQSGSMQGDRQKQMQDSHESSSPAIGTHGQRQQEGAGSMNEHNTTKTGQGTAEIPDQRAQDDTAP